jgi:spore coat protein U-like protein
VLSAAASQAQGQTVNCTISATPMAFGNYNPSSTTALGPATSTVTAQCSVPPGSGNVAGFTMSVALSTGSSGTYATRRMTSTPAMDTVSYNIFTSATRSAIWGDGSAGSVTVPLTIAKLTPGQSGAASAVAYGFVPPLQDVAAADYADTIAVIANW